MDVKVLHEEIQNLNSKVNKQNEVISQQQEQIQYLISAFNFSTETLSKDQTKLCIQKQDLRLPGQSDLLEHQARTNNLKYLLQSRFH
jgi:uncharacterized coiled-coil protein SlyX